MIWNLDVEIRTGTPTVVRMSTTMLTKRRAVDNCRVSSALCRMR